MTEGLVKREMNIHDYLFERFIFFSPVCYHEQHYYPETYLGSKMSSAKGYDNVNKMLGVVVNNGGCE